MVQMVSLQVTSTTTQKSPEYLYGDKRRFSREFHETVTYLNNQFLPSYLSLFLPSRQTLRVQCPKGRFIVKELTLTSTLSNLQQCIADLTNIPPLHQKSEYVHYCQPTTTFSTMQYSMAILLLRSAHTRLMVT